MDREAGRRWYLVIAVVEVKKWCGVQVVGHPTTWCSDGYGSVGEHDMINDRRTIKSETRGWSSRTCFLVAADVEEFANKTGMNQSNVLCIDKHKTYVLKSSHWFLADHDACGDDVGSDDNDDGSEDDRVAWGWFEPSTRRTQDTKHRYTNSNILYKYFSIHSLRKQPWIRRSNIDDLYGQTAEHQSTSICFYKTLNVIIYYIISVHCFIFKMLVTTDSSS